MTTSDLIAEALIHFREDILLEVRKIVREEIRAGHYAITPRGSGAIKTDAVSKTYVTPSKRQKILQ